MLVSEIEAKLNRLHGERQGALRTQASRHAEVEQLTTYVAQLEEARRAIITLGAEYRKMFTDILCGLVTQAVQSVFGEHLTINLVEKPGGGLDFEVEQNSMVTDVMTSHGGSLVQVIGFVLRALLVHNDPRLDNVIVADEPFSMVSEEYRAALGGMLRELAEQLNMQFIIVTHDAELVDAADLAYEVSKPHRSAILTPLSVEREVMD